MQIFNRRWLLMILMILGLSFSTWGAGFFSNNVRGDNSIMANQPIIARLKIAFNDEQVVVSLYDSGASRQLLAQLPLTLSFSDFARTEKIAYLPSKLTTRDTPSARELTGDFTYYQPWGNLAIFYKGASSAGGLYVLGQIESGKEKLAAMQQNFTATIEKIE